MDEQYDDQSGLATGALLLILGVWIMLRTFVHDANGKNLVDRLVELGKGSSSSSGGSGPRNLVSLPGQGPHGFGITGPTGQPFPVAINKHDITISPDGSLSPAARIPIKHIGPFPIPDVVSNPFTRPPVHVGPVPVPDFLG